MNIGAGLQSRSNRVAINASAMPKALCHCLDSGKDFQAVYILSGKGTLGIHCSKHAHLFWLGHHVWLSHINHDHAQQGEQAVRKASIHQ